MTNKKTAFGFWVYLMSDCILFAALFATFMVLREAVASGPSMYQLVDLKHATYETVILLTSSFTMGLSLLAASSKKKSLTIASLFLTLVLGLIFISLEMSEFVGILTTGNGPYTSAFLSAYFVLVGTHGAHIAVGALWMLILIFYISIRGLTENNIRKLICLGLFWHFLDVIWICIFTFVYLFGSIHI